MTIKKSAYYLFFLAFVFAIMSVSNLLYFQDFTGLILYIGNNYFNIIAVSLVFFVMAYLFELINYNKEHTKDRTVIELFNRLVLAMLITLVADFFIFFHSNMGRKAYFVAFVLFSLTFSIENYWYLKSKRKRKICVIGNQGHRNRLTYYFPSRPIQLIGKHQLDELAKKKTSLLYDERELSDKDILTLIKMKINGKDIEKINVFVEREKSVIPLKFVDNDWLLQHIECTNLIERKNSDTILWILSLVFLVVFFPAGFLVAQLHRLKSRGPIFYRQERIGKNNKKFMAIKFRTMRHHAETKGAQFSDRNDVRKNKIGHVMRKFRIDEIPQLFNVLKGDMNLIGPRPEREVFISKLEKQIPFYRLRLEVKPGITGWAQVNVHYAGENLDDHFKKLEYDLYYIKNKNLVFDLMILMKTIKTVFSGKGI